MRWLLVLILFTSAARALPAEPPKGQFPVGETDDAWAKLPRENPPLPSWAKILVEPLPRTTAKMLELDYFPREKNPLGPELSALLRWTAADALGSDYGRMTAEADLRRAGVPPKIMAKLGEKDGLDPDVRIATAFARKLTLDGHAITDAEFATLLRVYGPEKVTAIVHTVAYANFHNRVVLGIGASMPPFRPVDANLLPQRAAGEDPRKPTRRSWDEEKWTRRACPSASIGGPGGAEQMSLALQKSRREQLHCESPFPDPSRIKATSRNRNGSKPSGSCGRTSAAGISRKCPGCGSRS